MSAEEGVNPTTRAGGPEPASSPFGCPNLLERLPAQSMGATLWAASPQMRVSRVATPDVPAPPATRRLSRSGASPLASTLRCPLRTTPTCQAVTAHAADGKPSGGLTAGQWLNSGCRASRSGWRTLVRAVCDTDPSVESEADYQRWFSEEATTGCFGRPNAKSWNQTPPDTPLKHHPRQYNTGSPTLLH